MTREMAIQVLQTALTAPFIYGDYAEAIDMAIEAFKKEVERQEMIIRASERYLGLVRCKDCRHCMEYYDREGYPYWICDEWDGGTDADGFCHYGERKDGKDE